MSRRQLTIILQEWPEAPSRERVCCYIERQWLKLEPESDDYWLDTLDEARLRLICELERDFEPHDDALDLLLSLLDQLHGARSELAALVGAVERQPRKVQAEIFSHLVGRKIPHG